MIIDIDNYIDKIYVMYHTSHAQALLGDAQQRFEKMRTDALGNLLKNAANDQLAMQLNSTIDIKGDKARESFQTIDNQNLIFDAYESIANILNTSLQKAIQKDYGSSDPDFYAQQYLNKLSEFDNMLSNMNNVDVKKIDRFFILVQDALSLVNQNIDSGTMTILSEVFKTGKDQNNKLAEIDRKDITVADKVITYLAKAADELAKGKSISKDSFQGTLSNIFNTAIGETLAELMVLSAVSEIDEEVLKILNKKGIQLASKTGGKWELSGTKRTDNKQKKTAKVDMLQNGLFQITLFINGQETTIEIATNYSFKFGKAKSRSSNISILKGSMGTVIESYKDNETKTYIYNVIAHRLSPNYPDGQIGKNGFFAAYSTLRQTITASFFNEWIAGSNQPLTGGGQDLAQFIFYNGKLYSVLSVIKKAIEIQNDTSRRVGFTADIRGFMVNGEQRVKNTWESGDGDWSKRWEYAEWRSNAVKAAINALSIQGNLKSYIFKALDQETNKT